MRKYKLTRLFQVILAVMAIITAIVCARPLTKGVFTGIQICLNNLVPSLFLFMVLSSFLVRSGIGEQVFFLISKPLSKAFHIPERFVVIFCFSLLGGFPVGAKLIADAVERQEMDAATGRRMLAYCVNCGPAFLISAVSLPVFRNITVGLVVYLSQILAAIAVGIISGLKKDMPELPAALSGRRVSLSNELVSAVSSTVQSMSLVCAFVIIFTGVSQLLKDSGVLSAVTSLLEHVMTKEAANSLIIGILEVTSGCNELQSCRSLLLFAFIAGFGGLCVHIQVKAILNRAGVKMGLFYLYRPVYIALSLFFSMVLIRFFGGTASVMAAQDIPVPKIYSVSPLGSILLVILAVLLLLSTRKSDIIEKNEKRASK